MSKDTGSGPLRWLHLSDLHFKAEEKWDRRATLAALIRKVKELKEEGRGPDLVFLTGDIAFSGKKPMTRRSSWSISARRRQGWRRCRGCLPTTSLDLTSRPKR